MRACAHPTSAMGSRSPECSLILPHSFSLTPTLSLSRTRSHPVVHDACMMHKQCRYKLPVVVLVMNNGGIYGGDRRTAALADAAARGLNGAGFSSDPAPTSFVEGSR